MAGSFWYGMWFGNQCKRALSGKFVFDIRLNPFITQLPFPYWISTASLIDHLAAFTFCKTFSFANDPANNNYLPPPSKVISPFQNLVKTTRGLTLWWNSFALVRKAHLRSLSDHPLPLELESSKAQKFDEENAIIQSTNKNSRNPELNS